MEQALEPTPTELAPVITPPPTPDPNPKPNRIFPIILTVLITSLMLIGGYFGYQYWLKNKTFYCTLELMTCPDGSYVGRAGPDCEFASCPGIPNPNQTIATPDFASNWQTYTNSRYGYRFQYPQSLSLSETDGFEDSNLITGEKIQQILLENDALSINIYFEGGFDHGFDPWELNSKTPITIDNKPAMKTSLTSSESDGLWIIYSIENFHSFRIEASTDQSNQAVVDEILSTFNFDASSANSFTNQPAVTTETQMGYIDSIIKNGDKYSLNIDYANMLSGDEAKQQMLTEKVCDSIDTCDLPNDYYISNVNPKIRTFSISPSVTIDVSTSHQSINLENVDASNKQTISFDQLLTLVKTEEYQVPWWITITDGVVTHISEQYLP